MAEVRRNQQQGSVHVLPLAMSLPLQQRAQQLQQQYRSRAMWQAVNSSRGVCTCCCSVLTVAMGLQLRQRLRQLQQDRRKAVAEGQQQQGSVQVLLQRAACSYHSVAVEPFMAEVPPSATDLASGVVVETGSSLPALSGWWMAADTEAGTVLQGRVLMCTGCFGGGGRVCLYQSIVSSVCPGS
jgi:hypothetical protein